jgi:hypothetical protein
MSALGTLLVILVGMIVISVLGVLFLFLSKNQKLKTGVFYFLVVWAILIALISATALPTNYVAAQVISWVIGGIGVVGLLIRVIGKSEKKLAIANTAVALSVVAGLVNMLVV